MKSVGKSLFGLTVIASASFSAYAANNNQPNIDNVLGQLSAQHNNASSLVKSARQPASLALNSPLMAQNSKAAKASDADTPVLEKLSAVASSTVNKFKQTGLASWYGRQFHGRKTASGETFDMNAMTAAHSSLPMNCYVRVTNRDNGKSVVVKINDRPTSGGSALSLSYGAAKAIGMTGNVGNVTIERID